METNFTCATWFWTARNAKTTGTVQVLTGIPAEAGTTVA
jgi:hypothetical protein